MSISEALGEQQEVQLPRARSATASAARASRSSSSTALLVNGDLWRKVVPELSKDYRCIAPDLPLGSHDAADERGRRPLPARRCAKLIDDFLAALDLRRRDAGRQRHRRRALPDGRHPAPGADRAPGADALRRLRELPPALLQVPAGAGAVAVGGTRCCFSRCAFRAMRNSPIGFGWLSKNGHRRRDHRRLAGARAPRTPAFAATSRR